MSILFFYLFVTPPFLVVLESFGIKSSLISLFCLLSLETCISESL